MSSPRLFTARAVTPVLAASVLLIVAVAWSRGTGTVSAATAAGLPLQAGGSCLLTSTQELNSIKTWLKMMPVFRHPRCLNCHGGIPKPLKDFSTKHAGVVQLDSSDNAQTCEECHAEGWGDAAAAPTWTNKTDVQICRGMHISFDGDARSFLDHIVRDGGRTPFIKLAFEGKRGLTDGGQTIYEAETGRSMSAAPPPGSHAQLIQQAKDWVAAQGGSFVGDPDCGCVVDKLEVHLKTSLQIVNDGPANETGTIRGEGRILLKLAPDLSEPDWELTTGAGQSTAKITWSFVDVTRSNGCIVAILSNPPTEFDFWLGMSVKPEPKFALQIVPAPDIHATRWRCPRPPPLSGMVAAPAGETDAIFSAAWSSIHGGPGAGPMQGLAPLAPGAAPTQPAGGFDMQKVMSMKPEELAAMAEKMKNNQTPAGMADLGKLMNQVVPNANQMMEAARTNFRFAIPDAKWCKLETGTAFLAQCVISQELKLPDNKGSTQTITETTIITIGRPKP
ncbi:MAG TPA: hypothetical protein VGQ69_03950 [Gemmatimonadales bacterium]|nr:hypothetical protein [Gemmatimonadales bacterium]